MKNIILVLILLIGLSGCSDNKENNVKEWTLIESNHMFNKYCYDGLVLVKAGYSKYSNGYFYKRDKAGKLIQCN